MYNKDPPSSLYIEAQFLNKEKTLLIEGLQSFNSFSLLTIELINKKNRILASFKIL